MEDAYAAMKDCDYSGSLEDFEALCARAVRDMAMDIDDMDLVAGGGFGDMIDTVTGALSKTWEWMQENPALTAEIVGGSVVAVAGITVGVKYLQKKDADQNGITPEETVFRAAEQATRPMYIEPRSPSMGRPDFSTKDALGR